MKHNNNNYRIIEYKKITRGIGKAVNTFNKIDNKCKLLKNPSVFVKGVTDPVKVGDLCLFKLRKDALNGAIRRIMGVRVKPPLLKIPSFLFLLVRKGKSGDEVTKTAVMSLFSVTRLVSWKPVIDVSSIWKPFTGVDQLDLTELGEVCKRFPYGKPYDPKIKFKPSGAAGPSGPNAWKGGVEDRIATRLSYLNYLVKFVHGQAKSLGERNKVYLGGMSVHYSGNMTNDIEVLDRWIDLNMPIRREYSYSGGSKNMPIEPKVLDVLTSRLALNKIPNRNILGSICYFNHLAQGLMNKGELIYSDLIAHLKGPKSKLSGKWDHSRLAFIKDKNAKTRMVALSDIGTKAVLEGLHDHLFSVLREMETDGTFNQDRQRDRVREVLIKNQEKGSKTTLFSVDMTNCTDRLPAILQMVVLGKTGLASSEMSIAGYLLLTSRLFRVGKSKQFVGYTVGQPMGVISSGAAMAISHHMLVQGAAKRAGVHGFFKEYSILGDDIVLGQPKVARQYMRLLKEIGVEVSVAKSYIGTDVAEFAKSLFYKDKDLSPIPPHLLVSTIRRERYDHLVSIAQLFERKFVSRLTSKMGSGVQRNNPFGQLWMWFRSIYPNIRPDVIRRLLISNKVRLFSTGYERTLSTCEKTLVQAVDYNLDLSRGIPLSEIKLYNELVSTLLPVRLPNGRLMDGKPRIGPLDTIITSFERGVGYSINYHPGIGKTYLTVGIIVGTSGVAWDPLLLDENPLNNRPQVSLSSEQSHKVSVNVQLVSESLKFIYRRSGFSLYRMTDEGKRGEPYGKVEAPQFSHLPIKEDLWRSNILPLYNDRSHDGWGFSNSGQSRRSICSGGKDQEPINGPPILLALFRITLGRRFRTSAGDSCISTVVDKEVGLAFPRYELVLIENQFDNNQETFTRSGSVIGHRLSHSFTR